MIAFFLGNRILMMFIFALMTIISTIIGIKNIIKLIKLLKGEIK